ncbi:MraY family glycosyltransferase [Pedobacter nutrimenti]|uniref:MraY family glycosyltransferase n=1 Tax=Pedobacter nutrimenti TaxID=1241337 RepID=UPI00292CF621|nr:MraY family glycosyltransferase [Pedobacter nutrimenti]
MFTTIGHIKKEIMLLTIIFLTSLLLVVFAIPPIITLAVRKRLFDAPAESRKIHKRIIPNFGGVAIFTAFIFSCSLFIPTALLPHARLLMAAGLILFMIGLKDDMIGLSPLIKFGAQFANALIIAVIADLRIENLHGILGFDHLNYYASVALTVIVMVGVINAFNLIDGIDGLAASLGVMVSLTYAFLFFQAGEIGWAYLAIALTGALIGFLFYNITPARIFMGDCGSLVLGFISIVLSIKFLNLSDAKAISFGVVPITANLGLVLAVLIIPVFDTLRVFTLRMLNKKSPFTADSNHLHHRLLSLGLSHVQSTLILTVTNSLFVVMAVSLQFLGNAQLVGLIIATALCSNGLLTLYIGKYRRPIVVNTVTTGPAVKEKSFGEQVLEKISEN